MELCTRTAGSALEISFAPEPGLFGLTAEDLFRIALRRNPQRAFLFVSRVLGKHLPIAPNVLPAAGRLLALALEGEQDGGIWPGVLRGTEQIPFPRLMERLEQEQSVLEPENDTLFVGFAETATGLGRAAAACFSGACTYVSTTRLTLPERECLTFQESHSHAKTHLLYLDGSVQTCRRAVIIDDEFTTGSTALHLVQAVHQRLGIRQFVLLSLLDWGQDSPRQKLADALGVEIRSVSLLRGKIQNVKNRPPESLPEQFQERTGSEIPVRYLSPDTYPYTGRLPLSAQAQARSRQRCRELAETLDQAGPDSLVLGVGELIYEPCLIAGYLGAPAFHSTTQSPVCPVPGSGVENGVRFLPPDRCGGAGYLYNVPQGRCRKALILAERENVQIPALEQLAAWLKSRGCSHTEVALL